jgi:hypothetical protein
MRQLRRAARGAALVKQDFEADEAQPRLSHTRLFQVITLSRVVQ